MNKIKEFFTKSYDELMHKVSWPSQEELRGSAIVVSVAVLILSLLVFVMDKASNSAMSTFYNLFK